MKMSRFAGWLSKTIIGTLMLLAAVASSAAKDNYKYCAEKRIEQSSSSLRDGLNLETARVWFGYSIICLAKPSLCGRSRTPSMA